MASLFLNSIKKNILDIFFPNECLNCRREGNLLCFNCLNKIELNRIEYCSVCKQNSIYGETHNRCQNKTYLNGLIVATTFKNTLLRQVIHKFKYGLINKLSFPLAQILINKILFLRQKEGSLNMINLLFNKKLIIIPVPLHKRKEHWRGFNQSELLAKIIANKFGVIENSNILRRIKYRQSQTKLKKQVRLDNIKGSFKINKEWKSKLKSTNILLVDDVFTTGATLNECAKELKKYGATNIWGIVLARG